MFLIYFQFNQELKNCDWEEWVSDWVELSVLSKGTTRLEPATQRSKVRRADHHTTPEGGEGQMCSVLNSIRFRDFSSM